MAIKKKLPIHKKVEAEATKETTGLDEVFARPIEEIELSVRTANCLWDAKIQTIGELVKKTEDELLSLKHFDRRSLKEIKEILADMGVSLGMK